MVIEATHVGMQPEQPALTDEELWAVCCRGDRRAFRMLVERHKRQAYRIAYSLVGSPDDAWDLSQDAFVRIWKARKSFKAGLDFFPWFYSVIANLCRNHLRARGVRDKHQGRLIRDAEQRQQQQKSPDEVYAERELKSRMWLAIGKLPEGFREIIIMKHFREMTYEQIAKAIGIPIGSVMSRLYYARRKLREIVEAEFGGSIPTDSRGSSDDSSAGPFKKTATGRRGEKR